MYVGMITNFETAETIRRCDDQNLQMVKDEMEASLLHLILNGSSSGYVYAIYRNEPFEVVEMTHIQVVARKS